MTANSSDKINIQYIVEPVCKSRTDSANLEVTFSKHYEAPPFPIFGPDQRKCKHCLRKILNWPESLVRHILDAHQDHGYSLVNERLGHFAQYLNVADNLLKDLREKQKIVKSLNEENEALKMKVAEYELKLSEYETIVID